MSDVIRPFMLDIPQTELDDLQRRLAATRWPEKEAVPDWTQGSPLAKVQALVDHWRNHYDWRRAEARLNALGQFKTEIDGLDIHSAKTAIDFQTLTGVEVDTDMLREALDEYLS